MASNFAGVPLAAAFIFTLGRIGLVTAAFELVGVDLYDTGFSLYTFWGLTLVYLYFQIPLMVLVILPALDGLKKDWREAAENLGATPRQYWRRVAFPVLLPSILGTMILACSATPSEPTPPPTHSPVGSFRWPRSSSASRSQETSSTIRASAMRWRWEWC